MAFEITPVIVPVDQACTFRLSPSAAATVPAIDFDALEVFCFPLENPGQIGTLAPVAFTVDEDGICITFCCTAEQEYIVHLKDTRDGKTVDELHIYALDDDLIRFYPWKGDFHMHSDRSDGKEPPAYVAASCRKIGLDFMALTDHHKYAPSLEAISAFAELDLDFRIFPGEEVHPPRNPIHMINFGGEFSVNALWKTEEYEEGVAANLPRYEAIPELNEDEQYQLASCRWCFDKIKEANGISVFCHPYWYYRHRYNVSENVHKVMVDEMPFDAYELLGGYHRHETDSNVLQVARYHEERARGVNLPIIGVSDSHGCDTGELFGWYYTVVYCESPDIPEIRSAIANLQSVAVEAITGETVRVYGPFRLVKLTLFLLKHVFGGHDEICRSEGEKLLSSLLPESEPEDIHIEKGAVADYYRTIGFGR